MEREPAPVTNIRRKMQVQHNIDTGESSRVIVDEHVGRNGAKARRKLYLLLDLDMIQLVDMTGLQWRIFMQIAHAVEQESNIARTTGPEIARALGSHQPTVNRSMQDMLARKIIFKLGNGRYRINLHLAYRGQSKVWEQLAMDEDIPQMRREHR